MIRPDIEKLKQQIEHEPNKCFSPQFVKEVLIDYIIEIEREIEELNEVYVH